MKRKRFGSSLIRASKVSKLFLRMRIDEPIAIMTRKVQFFLPDLKAFRLKVLTFDHYFVHDQSQLLPQSSF